MPLTFHHLDFVQRVEIAATVAEKCLRIFALPRDCGSELERMRVLGLRGRVPKRFRRTTQSNPAHAPAPNVLARRFHWPEPNQAWVGDLTYVWTRNGWAYLALLVDLCTRRITGWALGHNCDAALALKALQNAVARHRPSPGLIHHTDPGATYPAGNCKDALADFEMVASMSAKGDC